MKGTKNISIKRIEKNNTSEKSDVVIQESPLQIIVAYGEANSRKKEKIIWQVISKKKELAANIRFSFLLVWLVYLAY